MRIHPSCWGRYPISAKTGEGLDELLSASGWSFEGYRRPMKVVIPYAQGGLLARIHRDGQVLSEEYAATA